jgi:hypothetical protein
MIRAIAVCSHDSPLRVTISLFIRDRKTTIRGISSGGSRSSHQHQMSSGPPFSNAIIDHGVKESTLEELSSSTSRTERTRWTLTKDRAAVERVFTFKTFRKTWVSQSTVISFSLRWLRKRRLPMIDLDTGLYERHSRRIHSSKTSSGMVECKSIRQTYQEIGQDLLVESKLIRRAGIQPNFHPVDNSQPSGLEST